MGGPGETRGYRKKRKKREKKNARMDVLYIPLHTGLVSRYADSWFPFTYSSSTIRGRLQIEKYKAIRDFVKLSIYVKGILIHFFFHNKKNN